MAFVTIGFFTNLEFTKYISKLRFALVITGFPMKPRTVTAGSPVSCDL